MWGSEGNLCSQVSPLHFDVLPRHLGASVSWGGLAPQVQLPSEPFSQQYFSLIPNLILYRILCLTAGYQSAFNMHQPVAALVTGWKDHLFLQRVTKLPGISTPKDSCWAFCATNVS